MKVLGGQTVMIIIVTKTHTHTHPPYGLHESNEKAHQVGGRGVDEQLAGPTGTSEKMNGSA